MLFRGAHILILDEPTSVLAPHEAKNLFTTLKALAKGGRSIIFITHKLDEVLSVCDRITVLKNGKVIKTADARKTNKRKLAKMMVGREVVFQVSKSPCKKGNVVLEVRNLNALNDRGLVAVKDVSFTVYQHEILGLAGVAGNGQKELAEVITGLRESKRGKVLIAEKDLTNRSADMINKEGVCHIPEDRLGSGIIPVFSITDNMILESYSDPPFSKHFFMNDMIIKEMVEKLIKDFDIRTPSQKVPALNLSGGNIQKLILARGLSRHPKLIIANNPTTGLDVGATEYIQQKLIEERDKGAAIVLISEDLDEILSLSDRIAVIYEGSIRLVPPEGAKPEEIGLMMTTK
jgi:simple sugar transport system ATP-binding protein